MDEAYSQEPIILPVPAPFRRYVSRRPNRIHVGVIGLIWPMVISAAYAYDRTHTVHTIDAVGIGLAMLCCAIPWLIDLYKPWRYTIDSKGMTLIYLTEDAKRWSWEHLRWHQEVLRSFEPTEWRGLPALSITYESYIGRGRKMTAYMVYRPEDSETVRERVIPILEHYLPHSPKHRIGYRALTPAAPAEKA